HYGLVTTLRQINTFLGSPEGIPINVRDAVNVFQTRVFKYYLVYTPVESGDQYIYSAAYAGELKGHIVYEHPPWDDNRYQYGVPDVELTIPLIPHYNCSLFAEKQFIPPNYIPPWDDQNLRYVRGDIVEYDGDLWVARYDNDPIVANRPDNDPNLWENIGDTVDTDLMVYGCLEASFQSEDSLSAIWQARRTFIT
ncbi:MAG: hypothetical protein GWN55_13105, partial [Phycisphaerae bacterium]|nr:hypothetical protein [Phycisphaerae bacterium]NIU28057.1 hypothetical protein [candidate division KSB1 bacterium]NIP51040.1 hypothetical protein [Phycisphaerae bacterium]NIS50260.1 hypothetical protein [Phycisphaerae bacterium]NIV02235.1 hypothetical protein [Phycisphaerae bacterium]